MMSLQGSKASVRLIERSESGDDEETRLCPGDELIIRSDNTSGVFIHIERNGVPLRFQLSEAYDLDWLPLRTGTLATRAMITHLTGLISSMTGYELVCISDQQTSWVYVFRET